MGLIYSYKLSDPCGQAFKMARRMDDAAIAFANNCKLAGLTRDADAVMVGLNPFQQFIMAAKLYGMIRHHSVSPALMYLIERHNSLMTGLNVDRQPAMMDFAHYRAEYATTDKLHARAKEVFRCAAYVAEKFCPDWWLNDTIRDQIAPNLWQLMHMSFADSLNPAALCQECSHAKKSKLSPHRSAAADEWLNQLSMAVKQRIGLARKEIENDWTKIVQAKSAPQFPADKMALTRYNKAGKIYSRGYHPKTGDNLDLTHSLETDPSLAAQYLLDWSLINLDNPDLAAVIKDCKATAPSTRFEIDTIAFKIRSSQELITYRESIVDKIWHGSKPKANGDTNAPMKTPTNSASRPPHFARLQFWNWGKLRHQ